MIAARKSLPALAGQQMELVNTGNPHVLSFVRYHESHRLIVAANFSEHPQQIRGNLIRTAGLGRFFEDALTGTTHSTSEDVHLDSYQILWLCRV